MIKLSIQKTLNFSKGTMPLDIDLNIHKGEFIGLYGASGAGKTSLLRILGGLLNANQGEIVVDNETWFNSAKKINLCPQRRQVGFVFQDYALFPNMTVKENLQFALKKGQDNNIVNELIELTKLGSFQYAKPKFLSGGQQQRVALARALVQQPKLLLLDEPLSALDAIMRRQLQDYLLKTHQTYGTTTILVSHDVNELSKLTDRVVHLEGGKIINIDKADFIFKKSKYQLKGRVIGIETTEKQQLLIVKIGENQIQVYKNIKEKYNLNDVIEIEIGIEHLL